MDYEKDPQVIFFKDLLFVAAYPWRKILAVALILAVLFGAVGAAKELTKNPAAQAQQEHERNMSSYLSARSEYQERVKACEDTLAQLEKILAKNPSDIESQRTYLEESNLMQMDAYDFYRGSASFYVDTGYKILPDNSYQSPDNTPAVCALYENLLTIQGFEKIAAQMNTQRKYVAEVANIAYNGQILSLNVNHATQEGAQQILQMMIDEIKSYQITVSDSVGDHTLQLMASQVYNTMDTSLSNRHSNERTKLYNMERELADAQFSFENAENELELAQNKLASLTEPVLSTAGTKSGVVKQGVVYALIGAFLGVIVIAGIACVMHIAGDKIYSARTLRNRVGLKILGCTPAAAVKNPVDRWLKKLEGRCVEENLDVLAALIHSQCEGQVLVAGGASEAVIQALLLSLDKAGVKTVSYGSLLSSAQAVEAMRTCDAVLLVEECGKSRYIRVEREMEMICGSGKQLLGCLLADG